MNFLDRAKKIDGWMSEDELRWLNVQAIGRSCVMEIGSWGGRSAMALREARDLICVDHWKGDSRIQHYLGSKFNEECAKKEKQFHDVHADGINEDRVHVIKADTSTSQGIFKVMRFFREKKLAPTMVFVDGAHDYENASSDIQLALQVAKPGALICGHDYYEQEMPGLVEAIKEFLPNFDRGAGTLWYAYKN